LTGKNHIIDFCKHSGMVNHKFKEGNKQQRQKILSFICPIY